MDSRDLRYFRAIAEQCSFSRAADVLHVSQAALSRAVQRLEVDLDAAEQTEQEPAADAGEAATKLPVLLVLSEEEGGALEAWWRTTLGQPTSLRTLALLLSKCEFRQFKQLSE